MRACHPAAAVLAFTGLVGLALPSACKKSEASAPLADVTAGEHGFTPASLKIPAGGPGSHGTVSFVRTTDKTCATEVVFPDLNIEKKLPLNQVVQVDLPTDTAKTLTFQCGMAMYKGAVVVTAK
jgi:plastocyanin domain-containing protein